MDTPANAFQVLGATPRDRKSRLMELAEDASLHGDAEAADVARSTLVNPRNRLAAEIAWFPGVAPGRIDAALAALRDGRDVDAAESSLPPLCAANLELVRLAAGGKADAAKLQQAILRVADFVERLDPQAVLLAINEDRQAACFPPVADVALVEQEIAERVRLYQRVLTERLDSLPTALMVAAYEKLSRDAGAPGHATPRLVSELLAAYELHAGQFLAGEAERILGIVDATRKAADAKAPADLVQAKVRQIAAAIVDWDRVAQPIQLARQRAGLDHEDSNRLAFRTRSLAVHLFNAHDYLAESKLLSDTLHEVFAEVAAVTDVVEADVRALNDIEAQRQARVAEEAAAKAKFAAEVTWETTLGLLFKDKLRISPDGIEYKQRLAPAAQLQGLAWGAVRMIVNGRDTGTQYFFRFASPITGVVEVMLGNEAQYQEIVPRAWRAFCVPLMLQFLAKWRAGEGVRIGDHEVRDEGIVLKKSKGMFRGDEWRLFPWASMRKGAHGGVLTFHGSPETDFTAAFNYRETLNAHILDFVVERVWQGKADRLSRIFDQE